MSCFDVSSVIEFTTPLVKATGQSKHTHIYSHARTHVRDDREVVSVRGHADVAMDRCLMGRVEWAPDDHKNNPSINPPYRMHDPVPISAHTDMYLCMLDNR